MSDLNATRLDLDDLRRTVAQVLDVTAADVTDDVVFTDDLGANSLLALEVLVVLEEKYGVTFTEAEAVSMTSLPRTWELLSAKLGGQGHAGGCG